MIKSLRKRPRADRFENDVRARKAKYGKYVYLSLVALVVVWVADQLVGRMLWLRADGLVSAERMVVGTPYESQILDLFVKEGDLVEEGQRVAKIYSPSIADSIAKLASYHAETQARYSELVVRAEVAKSLIEIAEDRSKQVDGATVQMRNAKSTGLLTNQEWANVLNDRFEARRDVVAIRAEADVVSRQLETLDAAQAEAEIALAEMRNRYADGDIFAPASGIVGSGIANKGHVTQIGGQLLDMYVGEPFVLAYLETGTLYEVNPGDRVTVSSGFIETKGTVRRVLPVADQLPPEFQKTFEPKARSQVVHVQLDDPQRLRLLSKVTIESIDHPLSGQIYRKLGGELVDWVKDTAAPSVQAWASDLID